MVLPRVDVEVEEVMPKGHNLEATAPQQKIRGGEEGPRRIRKLGKTKS